MPRSRVKFDLAGWDKLVSDIIDTEGVDRMSRVADAANTHIESDGYKVSVEGDKPLSKRDYRATVITANAEAMRDNQKHNRLIGEFYRAAGD